MATPRTDTYRPSRALLVLAASSIALTWPLAAVLWFRVGEPAFATCLFLAGISLGPCMAAYALLRPPHKQAARRMVLFTGGLSIVAFSVLGRVTVDLEGFFMLLLTATMGAAIGHTMITVILGPVFFGRFLCGWGCWRGMILELLPVGHGSGRRAGHWRWLPFAGLAASVGGATLSALVLGHKAGGTPGAMHEGSLAALGAGYGIYYFVSIGLAFALKDQRAFCKYLCPSGLILGLTSRLAVLKMATNRERCNDCGACSRVCPMDIDVAQFVKRGMRVASGQCILCQRCAHGCPNEALRLSAGFDVAGRTPFRVRG